MQPFESIETAYASRVEWGDCDPAGIIFYPTYFRWMDAATWALFEAVGYGPERMRREGRATPLVAAECSFRAPARHGERCEIRSRIERIGGTSFRVAHEVYGDSGVHLASGFETRVWARFSDGPGSPLRGEPIAEGFRAMFRAS